jgi:hypothetical protein
LTTLGIQSQVNTRQAPAVVGDFTDANPRYSTLAGEGGVVAGPSGLTIGLFAWLNSEWLDSDGAPAAANNFGGGPVAGFVGRNQQGLITTYLSDAGMNIPAGFEVTIFSAGGFWVLNNGAGAAYPGMKAYANPANGQASFAAAGAPSTAQATLSTIAAGTAATFNGTIGGASGNVLMTTGAVTNTIYPGAVLTGAGVPTGVTIVAQLTGTPGGAGTYALNVSELSIASEALTATPYVWDATGGVTTGTISLGSVITSSGTPTGVVNGAVVTAVATPAANKYIVGMVNNPGLAMGTAASGTIVVSTNVETSWYCRSTGAAGELVKISNVPGLG